MLSINERLVCNYIGLLDSKENKTIATLIRVKSLQELWASGSKSECDCIIIDRMRCLKTSWTSPVYEPRVRDLMIASLQSPILMLPNYLIWIPLLLLYYYVRRALSCYSSAMTVYDYIENRQCPECHYQICNRASNDDYFDISRCPECGYYYPFIPVNTTEDLYANREVYFNMFSI
jgi:hypothetical protein